MLAGEECLSSEESRALQRYFNLVTPELAAPREAVDRLRAMLPELPQTMVFEERPAGNVRPTFRHHRGEYLSSREPVEPGIPVVFSSATGRYPANRLELARWLVSSDNPLAARVTVNRAWQAFFGRGLAGSAGDFGTQAEPPTHPELLDWLAHEFVAGGWSLKHLHRQIVLSSTYRQSSTASPELIRGDPRNRLLARGPRFRVPAETVRDLMLSACGMLSAKQYGPSVYPPQPASVTALAYGSTKWAPSEGEDRFRRSIYTFSKRTAPFAAYAVFDSPTGENCIARRNRSNTPLQALTLLNDEMFLEMSRALARSAVARHPRSARDCALYIFRRLLTRPAEPAELAAIVSYQDGQRKRLERGELDAADIGNSPGTSASVAAWMMVARTLMNLDECITKP